MNHQERKDKIRKNSRERRRGLSREEKERESRQVQKRLRNLPEFQKAKTLLAYYPIQNEVNLIPFLREVLAEKTIALPIVADNSLLAKRVSSFDELSEGAYGIPEPINTPNILREEIDLVLVPGVAFDVRGFRLGFGKGYYDRFLEKYTGVSVGIAYDWQILEEVPRDSWDVSLDMVLSGGRLVVGEK